MNTIHVIKIFSIPVIVCCKTACVSTAESQVVEEPASDLFGSATVSVQCGFASDLDSASSLVDIIPNSSAVDKDEVTTDVQSDGVAMARASSPFFYKHLGMPKPSRRLSLFSPTQCVLDAMKAMGTEPQNIDKVICIEARGKTQVMFISVLMAMLELNSRYLAKGSGFLLGKVFPNVIWSGYGCIPATAISSGISLSSRKLARFWKVPSQLVISKGAQSVSSGLDIIQSVFTSVGNEFGKKTGSDATLTDLSNQHNCFVVGDELSKAIHHLCERHYVDREDKGKHKCDLLLTSQHRTKSALGDALLSFIVEANSNWRSEVSGKFAGQLKSVLSSVKSSPYVGAGLQKLEDKMRNTGSAAGWVIDMSKKALEGPAPSELPAPAGASMESQFATFADKLNPTKHQLTLHFDAITGWSNIGISISPTTKKNEYGKYRATIRFTVAIPEKFYDEGQNTPDYVQYEFAKTINNFLDDTKSGASKVFSGISKLSAACYDECV